MNPRFNFLTIFTGFRTGDFADVLIRTLFVSPITWQVMEACVESAASPSVTLSALRFAADVLGVLVDAQHLSIMDLSHGGQAAQVRPIWIHPMRSSVSCFAHAVQKGVFYASGVGQPSFSTSMVYGELTYKTAAEVLPL